MSSERKTNAPKSSRSRLFRALGDENRIRLLESLFSGPANVSKLASDHDLEQSLTSHHLGCLKKEGLVDSFRVGKEVFYRLAESVTRSGIANQLDLGCCRIMID